MTATPADRDRAKARDTLTRVVKQIAAFDYGAARDAIAAALAAARRDALEEAASFTEARMQAERGMRDICRRGRDWPMANAHGDRANALAEAVAAIRNMMEPDYNEGHIVPNATAIRQEEKPHCPSCNSPNTEQVVLNQWRCKACNQHFPWLGKPIKP